MLRITGGKVYDPANGIDGVVKDICIVGRPDRLGGRGRPRDRRHRHDRLPRRRRYPHARRRRRAQLRPGDDAREPSPGHGLPAHAGAPRGHRRPHAHDVRHRLSVRRHGLHDRHRSRRPGPDRQAHARRAARHAHRRQGLLRPDGQQRDRARPARGRRDRAGEGCRRLADLGGQGLRGQGRQSRRRHGLEVGQGRQGHVRAGAGLQQGDAGHDRREPGADRRPTRACRIRCICTATTWVPRATSPRRSRR